MEDLLSDLYRLAFREMMWFAEYRMTIYSTLHTVMIRVSSNFCSFGCSGHNYETPVVQGIIRSNVVIL